MTIERIPASNTAIYSEVTINDVPARSKALPAGYQVNVVMRPALRLSNGRSWYCGKPLDRFFYDLKAARRYAAKLAA